MKSLNKYELFSSLQHLENIWAEKYNKRAKGGRLAISGFRYQIYVFLLKLLKDWILLGNEERCSVENFQHHFESLSDIVSIEEEGLIISAQVKLSLRSSNLIDALDEFVTILDTAGESATNIYPYLKFMVITSRNLVSDTNKIVEGWVLDRKRKQGEIIDEIIKKLQISEVPIPENEILNILSFNLKCSNPLDTLQKWIGYLIDASHSQDTLYDAGKTIWNNIIVLWRTKINAEPVYFWQENDCPPDDVSIGEVLTGLRPSIRHLRSGYFHQRQDVYWKLENELINWVENKSSQIDKKIPLFWIGGRSGSGKSVALLYMMATIYQKGYKSIIWVGEKSTLLRSSLEVALDSCKHGNITIIGLDDPYIASENEKYTWKNIVEIYDSLNQYENNSLVPLIVACGPTEQAKIFKEDFYEYLDLKIFELPNETNAEITELRKWYYNRTGKLPPKIENENTLMVQLFFEWENHATIAEFAGRLKKRIIEIDKSKGIINKLSRILALNRIYVGYPKNAVREGLTPEQSDFIDQLEKEHIGESEMFGHQSYGLLHAHLANAIYLNWYEKGTSSYREHLRKGIIDSLNLGESPSSKTAPLWAIALIYRRENYSFIHERVGRKLACEISIDIYKYILSENNSNIPISILPVWIEICALAPEINFKPSPIDYAIQVIKYENINEIGLRLVCHKLLQHYDKLPLKLQGEVKNKLYIFLMDVADKWHEWPYIFDNTLLVTKDIRLIPILINMEKLISKNLLTKILCNALKTWPSNQEIKKIAYDYIYQKTYNVNIENLIITLIELNDGNIPSTIKEWLEHNLYSPDICLVLSMVLQKDYINFENIAIKWTKLFCKNKNASYVFEKILERRVYNEDIVDCCLEWLLTDHIGIDKSYTIEKLILNRKVNERLKEYILGWLKCDGIQNKSWGRIWNYCYEYCLMEYSILFELGMNWIYNVGFECKSISYVWPVLSKIVPKNSKLINVCKKRIITLDCNESEWVDILKYIYPNLNKADKDYYYKLGVEMQTKINIENEAWSYTWNKLFSINEKNEEMISIAINWLINTNINSPGWGQVWRSVYKGCTENEELVALGYKWLLNTNKEVGDFFCVWDALLKRNPNDDIILALGILVLIELDTRPGIWHNIWNTFNNKYPCNEYIFQIGREWIQYTERFNELWSDVWLKLVKISPNDVLMKELGMEYIKNTDITKRAWPLIWTILADEKYCGRHFYELAYSWINKVNINIKVWPKVWIKLVSYFTEDKLLYKFGREWASNHRLSDDWEEVVSYLDWDDIIKYLCSKE